MPAKIEFGLSDIDSAVKRVEGLLRAGKAVVIILKFRGREMAHTDLGSALLERFAQACVGISTVEKPSKLEGKSMSLFLSAKATK